MHANAEQRIALPRPVVRPSEAGALALATAYWEEIRLSTHGLVRARTTAAGVELVLVGGVSLLRFGAPLTRLDDDGVECRFPITGGLLARRPGGSLALRQSSPPRPTLSVAVEGYAPALDSGPGRPGVRSLAYHHLQERVHGVIGRRYLERMSGR